MTPTPLDKLDSSNGGADFLVNLPMAGGGAFEGGFPVLQTDDAKEGAAAVKLVTLYTKGAGLGMAPVITSGSLFTGSFVLNIMDQLSSTKFGIMCDKNRCSLMGIISTLQVNYIWMVLTKITL